MYELNLQYISSRYILHLYANKDNVLEEYMCSIENIHLISATGYITNYSEGKCRLLNGGICRDEQPG